MRQQINELREKDEQIHQQMIDLSESNSKKKKEIETLKQDQDVYIQVERKKLEDEKVEFENRVKE